MNPLLYIFGCTCIFCGKTVDPVCSDRICTDCNNEITDRHLRIPIGDCKESVSLYYYNGPVRKGLHRFKYGSKIAFGKECARLLADRYLQRGEKADLITCVPRAKDGLPRLYNQSAVIAKHLAKELNLPFDRNLLFKRTGMMTQPECPSRLAREKNAKRAYRKGKSTRDLDGLTVILVDDLYTTGATMNACASILKKQKAEKVLFYTACKVPPSNPVKLKINPKSTCIHVEFSDSSPYRHRYRIVHKDHR